MEDGKILYARQDRCCFFKLIGEIRQTISSGFDVTISKMLSEGLTETFIIDLRETSYIDSTNLGLLAKIARGAFEKKALKPTIVSGTEISVRA